MVLAERNDYRNKLFRFGIVYQVGRVLHWDSDSLAEYEFGWSFNSIEVGTYITVCKNFGL